MKPPVGDARRWSVTWHARATGCDALLWEEGFPAPLEGRWWYEALEQGGLEDQFTFLYAQVCDTAQRAVALAPCFVMDVPLEMFVPEPLVPLIRPLGRIFPALLQQRTLFVGSPCSDRGWVGLRRGLLPAECDEVIATLHAAILTRARALRAPMRVWKDFPLAFQRSLDRLVRAGNMFRVISFPGTEVLLPPGGLESYFLAIKPSRRQQLRRKLRRSHEAVDLRVEVLENPTPARLDPLFGLFWQTYENATTRFERLTPEFFAALAQAPCVRFIVLSHPTEDTPVAFMLVYVEGPMLINKFIGIDYNRPREWMLYFRLWEAAVHTALARGLQGIESGQTGYRAKISVGHHLIPLWNYCHHANPLLRAIYALVGRRISWASLDPELAELAELAEPAESAGEAP